MSNGKEKLQFDQNSIYLSCVDDGDYSKQFKNCLYYLLKFSELGEISHFTKKLQLLNISIENKIFAIDISNEKAYINNEQIEKLAKVRDFLRARGADLQVFESTKCYPLESAVIAKKEIENITKKIETAKLSTDNNRKLNNLEKFLWAYLYVANRQYSDSHNSAAVPRDITAILSGGEEVVCVGYAKLLKVICDKLGIESYVNYCEVLHNGKMGQYIEEHANNVVIIDGVPLYCDSCWDAISSKYSIPTISFCLLSHKVVKEKLNYVSLKNAPFINVEGDLKLAKNELIKLNNSLTIDFFDYFDSPLMNKYSEVVDILETDDNKQLLRHFLTELIAKLESLKTSEMFSATEITNSLINVFIASGYAQTKEQAQHLAGRVIHDSNTRTKGLFFEILQNYSGLENQ